MKSTKSIIVAIISIIALLACKEVKKTNTEKPVQTKKYKVEYIVDENKSSPIFDYKITYVDENGKKQSEQVTKLPWEKTFEVKAPFNTSFSVDYLPKNGVDIPEVISIEKNATLNIKEGANLIHSYTSASVLSVRKDKIEPMLAKNPLISLTYEIKE